MKRKLIALTLVLVLSFTLLSGCSRTDKTSQDSATATTAASTTTAATTTTAVAATTAAATTAVSAATTAPASDLPFVTLNWYTCVGNPDMPDTELVWKTLNEYFKEKINAEVTPHISTTADLQTTGAAMVAAGQEFDAIYVGQGLPYLENAARNAFVALDDLLPQYAPKTLATVPEYAWNAMRVKGTVWAIPSYKDLAQRLCLIYNDTMCKDIGIDPGAYPFYTTKGLVDFVYKAKELRDAKYPDLADTPIMNTGFHAFIYVYWFDQLLSNFAIANVPGINDFPAYDEGKTVFNMYETDEYRSWVNLVKQMVDDGVLPYDIENYDPDNARRNAGEFIGVVNAGLVTIDKNFYSNDWECGLAVGDKAYTYTTKITGNAQAISTTSKNPERALMMLELVNTDNYVATTLRFGVQDVDYKKLDNGQITFDGTKNEDPSNRAYYYWYGVQFGNIFAMSVPDTEPENFFDLMDAVNKSAYTSATMGFAFDPTSVSTEVAALSSTVTEYSKDMSGGMLDDPDSVLDEMIDSLKANGGEKVLAEVQSQLDTWNASR